jgi:hypothetical protein
MLFDLQNDPKEENNVAIQHSEVVSALRAKLDAHWTPKITTK